MILVRLSLFGRNKNSGLSKVLISEVEYTRYNIVYQPKNEEKEKTAKEVAEIICEEYERVLIERQVREDYSLLDEYEKREIIKEANLVSEDSEGLFFPDKNARKAEVEREVKEFLLENDTVIPRGFVDFRYRDLYFYVKKIVEEGAKRYFDKQEYEEFIYLLSMFVNSREKKEKTIHIIWDEEKVYLYNKRGRDVTDKYQKDFIGAAKKKNLNQEDLAISAVIAASPETLVLHTPPKTPLSEALEKIYEGRVKVCKGCPICKKD